jgi:hypothetical protein
LKYHLSIQSSFQMFFLLHRLLSPSECHLVDGQMMWKRVMTWVSVLAGVRARRWSLW